MQTSLNIVMIIAAVLVGVTLPPDLVKQADTVVGEGAKKK